MHTVSHVLTDTEYEHCELCTLITNTNQGTPLQVTVAQTAVSFVEFFDTSERNTITRYKAPSQKTILSDYFYNKPPPLIFLG